MKSRTTTKHIFSPFVYPGGKNWFVPIMFDWLDTNPIDVLFEPFAGGASVGLAALFTNRIGHLVLNDLDPIVSNVWRVCLSDEADQLAYMIEHFRMNKPNVQQVLNTTYKTPLWQAFATIVRNRVAFGGNMSKNGGAGIRNDVQKEWYPETLAKRIRALYNARHSITYKSQDATELIASLRLPMFIDPPYKVAGLRLYDTFNVDFDQLYQTLSGDVPFLLTHNHDITLMKYIVHYSWQSCPITSFFNGLNIQRDEYVVSNTALPAGLQNQAPKPIKPAQDKIVEPSVADVHHLAQAVDFFE